MRTVKNLNLNETILEQYNFRSFVLIFPLTERMYRLSPGEQSSDEMTGFAISWPTSILLWPVCSSVWIQGNLWLLQRSMFAGDHGLHGWSDVTLGARSLGARTVNVVRVKDNSVSWRCARMVLVAGCHAPSWESESESCPKTVHSIWNKTFYSKWPRSTCMFEHLGNGHFAFLHDQKNLQKYSDHLSWCLPRVHSHHGGTAWILAKATGYWLGTIWGPSKHTSPSGFQPIPPTFTRFWFVFILGWYFHTGVSENVVYP